MKSSFYIRSYQIEMLEEAMQLRFLEEIASSHPQSTLSQITNIVAEAHHYQIKEDSLVIRYVALYLDNVKPFTVKPSWIEYTLNNTEFSSSDKLSHIERNLVK